MIRRQRGPEGFPVFKATRTSTWNIDQIVDILGERVPGVDDSQKEFRVATVLVGNSEFPVTQEDIQVVRDELLVFSVQASLREVLDVSTYNFWDATGGRAWIKADELQEFRLSRAQAAP